MWASKIKNKIIIDFVLTIWGIASDKLVHWPFTFLTGEASFVINISHWNHFLGLKNFAIAPWTWSLWIIFGTLNGKGFYNWLIQKSWFRASPKKVIRKETITYTYYYTEIILKQQIKQIKIGNFLWLIF